MSGDIQFVKTASLYTFTRGRPTSVRSQRLSSLNARFGRVASGRFNDEDGSEINNVGFIAIVSAAVYEIWSLI
jgi:hypothetical protein